MSVIRIRDRLFSVAERRARRSPDGCGYARTRNESVKFQINGLFGMNHVESVRFIESPLLSGNGTKEELNDHLVPASVADVKNHLWR